MDPIVLSDEEDPSTPFPLRPKKRRTEPDPNPNPNRTVFVIDDDPTPHKSATPSIVPETPMSALFDSEIAIVKCTMLSDPAVMVSPKKFSGQILFPSLLSLHFSSISPFLFFFRHYSFSVIISKHKSAAFCSYLFYYAKLICYLEKKWHCIIRYLFVSVLICSFGFSSGIESVMLYDCCLFSV